MKNKLIKIKQLLDKSREQSLDEIFFEKEGSEFIVCPKVFSPIHFSDSLFFANNMLETNGLDILEIGTGTGLFAIKMAYNGARKVVATDIGLAACENALLNVKKFGLDNKISIREGNLFEPIEDEKFDLIFWNIPFCYVNDQAIEELCLNTPLDDFENSVFNFEYTLLEEYLRQGFKYLKNRGKLLLGFSPTIGNKNEFDKIALKLGLSHTILVSQDVKMGNEIETLQIIEFISAKIELQNVSVKFGSLKVLNDISLFLKGGEITTILGPSGSGKTTLLRCIAGLNNGYDGNIFINNLPQNEYFNKERIAIVNQGYSSFPWLTVEENIAVGIKRSSKSQVIDIAGIISAVGLNGFEKYYPSQLSGGMQQRVAIGRAIIQDTDILAFDEPFGALDYQTRLQLQKLIKEVRDSYGKTIIFVTHDIEEAIFISNRIIILSKCPSIVAADMNVNNFIKSSKDNDVRYSTDFINYRSKIENVIAR